MSILTKIFGDPNEKLQPIRIVGTRGGAFSGKVIVGSDADLKQLKATVSSFTQTGGNGTIPASAVTVRYASPFLSESMSNFRYVTAVNRLEALDPGLPHRAGETWTPRGLRARTRIALTESGVSRHGGRHR